MRTTGTVRSWSDGEGWGVIDSPDTPGGCWAHFSALRMDGFKGLVPGQAVVLDCEEAAQDGYDFRATVVWPGGTPATSAYSSGLDVTLDGGPAPIRVFRPADLVGADPTPGMDRQRAFELPLVWTGQVETAPGVVSGWHHHDINESSLYIVRGLLRFEFEGHDGYVEAGPGDFVHVPSFTVHRESNPLDEPSLAVIVRAGGGTPTVNVAPPEGRS
ncbi:MULTISPECIES: cupin domain-containing protein [unclassified Nocardioides]|uniref:cupin domain-containing protein n=1 Tax=unclassified Nocardioides TaxID=2615069 RepID=UPI0000571608|nr:MULTISPECIES: cupin domain-containing protein [unclassified Nocardioides]